MQHFDRRRNAGSQSAAADRHDNGVHIRQIIHDFQADCSLSRDDHRVVKRMDKRRAGFLLNAACLGIRIVIYAAVKHDVRAQLARRLHLGKRCARRHDDGRRHAECPRRQRNALRMVARRGRDDAAGAFFLGQAGDFDICTAHLEGACVLQVFRFQINLAVFIGQCLELHQTRALCDALEPLPRLQNHAKRKRHTLSLFFPANESGSPETLSRFLPKTLCSRISRFILVSCFSPSALWTGDPYLQRRYRRFRRATRSIPAPSTARWYDSEF